MEPKPAEKEKQAEDFLPIKGTDYIEFYVGNANQAAFFYKTAFGFQSVAYAGPETGIRDRVSYVLQQDKVRLILTAPLNPENYIAEHQKLHGDGVKAIALWVDDATKSFNETVNRGAKPYMEPTTKEDENGKVVLSGIYTYGETVHVFVERNEYDGPFMPGFQTWNPGYEAQPTGLKYVDHCVGNVGWGEMEKWVKFYEEVMGFKNMLSFDDEDIHTEYSALMSKVMADGEEKIKFPINEPAEGKKKSQIEEFLDYYRTPGVQHIAIATDNIIKTVEDLKSRGIPFIQVPSTYYEELESRVGKIDEDIESLSRLGILVDRDDDGYLLQIFTKPLQDRPTLFIEIIQRKGARSFGLGNFKALFEAIERDQAKRGNL